MSTQTTPSPVESNATNASHLRPGRYRLTVDIANPALDRRTRHDWITTTPAFTAGALFEVDEGRHSFEIEGILCKQWEIGLVGRKFNHQRLSVYSTDSRPDSQTLKDDPNLHLTWDLLPHLVRVDDGQVRKEAVAKAIKAADRITTDAGLASYTEAIQLINDILELKPRLLSEINDGSDEGAEIVRRIKAIRRT